MAKQADPTKRLIMYGFWLVLLLALAYQFLNPPQCPDHYTQEQIDASNCIIGANIGLGLILLFIWPTLVAVFALLVLAGYRRVFGKQSKRTKKTK